MHNEHIALRGGRLTLVPYLPHHVTHYHRWMTNPDLLEATCSEPLTLEEEIANQAAWLQSDEKLTFIVLAPLSAIVRPEVFAKAAMASGALNPCAMEEDSPAASICASHGGSRSTTLGDDGVGNSVMMTPQTAPLASFSPTTVAAPSSADGFRITAATAISEVAARMPLCMIGDCNAFVSKNDPTEAEVEVMIAEKAFRGQKLAKEAVAMLILYVARNVPGIQRFVAKILASNDTSKHLFTAGLGFAKFKDVPCFGEVHFELRNEPETLRRLEAIVAGSQGQVRGLAQEAYDYETHEGNVLHAVPVALLSLADGLGQLCMEEEAQLSNTHNATSNAAFGDGADDESSGDDL